MKTRYEIAKDIGFQVSEPGLLNWYVKDSGITIFLDFRTDDGYEEDMPPRIFASDEDEDGNTVWINDSGDTKDRWEEEVKNHWTVQKIEQESGLGTDRGQSRLQWWDDDGVVERQCDECGEMVPVDKLEDGLCIQGDMDGCYYDMNPTAVFRKAKRRKEQIRSERR